MKGGFYMDALKFDENLCAACPTSDCLVKCQYIVKNTAHRETTHFT
jgi:hypothetical protein